MTTIVNTHQSEAWNGYEGHHWASNQGRYDAINDAYNPILFEAAAIGADDRVLDVGCGNGQTTRLAAIQAHGGSVLGLDLSMPMLARARELAAGAELRNVRFEHGDAQVFSFAAGGFDVAISRFAIMFFADPVAAFANIRRALRPGGRAAFLAMNASPRNELLPVFDVVRAHIRVPEPADRAEEAGPAEQPGPMSLSDPAHVDEVFRAAGYADIRVSPVEADTWWGEDVANAVEFICGWGPVRHAFSYATRARTDAVRHDMADALRAHVTSDGVRLRGTANLIMAANGDRA